MEKYKDKDWLYNQYVIKKLSASEIQKLCSAGNGTIERWLRKFNIKVRNYSEAAKLRRKGRYWSSGNLSSEQIKKYRNKEWLYQKYWIEGLDSVQIAKVVGTRSNVIMRWLRVKNIKIKPKGENQKGKHLSKKARKAISIKAKKRWKSENYRKKMSIACKGKVAGKKNPNYGGIYSKKRSVREKISRANKGRKIGKKEMKRRLQSWKIRPTKLEKTFDKITPPVVRYVGDGSWWRKLNDGHYHNPDFKITGQNKVIEIWGNYWHKDDDGFGLINLYNLAGLECLIIRESEFYSLSNSPTKRILDDKRKRKMLKKVKSFIERPSRSSQLPLYHPCSSH